MVVFPESVHGCGMVAVPLMVAVVGSVMSVAPIDANALTLVMSIDANAFALALVVLELSEGKNQQPQRRERNHNKGIGTALPLVGCLAESNCESVAVPLMVAFALPLPELTEGKSQQPQRRERNHNKGITTALPWWVVLRSSDGCRCASVMSVAPIAATSLPWLLLNSHRAKSQQRAATKQGKTIVLQIVV